jgi:deaminated glutathione amidase
MVTAAAAQFAPGTDPEENAAAVDGFAARASRAGARLLVLPEYTSYTSAGPGRDLVEHAEPLDGPFVQRVAAVAARFGLWIVAGMAESVPGVSRVHNTLVYVDPTGMLAGCYRKVHLYDAFGFRESEWVLAGEPGPVDTFVVDGLCVSGQTCYDVRFPESSRRLVDAGVDVVVVPAQWAPGPLKEDHWATLLRARAIENTVFVVAADQAGPIGAGCSMIVDPMGVAVAAVGDGDGLITADLDRDRLDDVRAKNPSLAARRYRVVADGAVGGPDSPGDR